MMLCRVQPPGGSRPGQIRVEEGGEGIQRGTWRDSQNSIHPDTHTWAISDQDSTDPFLGEVGEKLAIRYMVGQHGHIWGNT